MRVCVCWRERIRTDQSVWVIIPLMNCALTDSRCVHQDGSVFAMGDCAATEGATLPQTAQVHTPAPDAAHIEGDLSVLTCLFVCTSRVCFQCLPCLFVCINVSLQCLVTLCVPRSMRLCNRFLCWITLPKSARACSCLVLRMLLSPLQLD